MTKLDIYEILAVLIVGIQLLGQANRDMALNQSKLPNRIVGLESPIVEMMGTVFLGMIGTGLVLAFQQLFKACKRWAKQGLRRLEGPTMQPSAA